MKIVVVVVVLLLLLLVVVVLVLVVLVLVLVVVVVVAAAADVDNRYELRMTTEHIEREVPFATSVSMSIITPDATMLIIIAVVETCNTGYGSPALTHRRLLLRA